MITHAESPNLCPNYVSKLQLQWGRVITHAERTDHTFNPWIGCTASMGPRDHSRGKVTKLIPTKALGDASMGPRDHSRGKLTESLRLLRNLLASMGPRDHSRGKDLGKHLPRFQSCASMGPRDHSRGKAARTPSHCTQNRSFNGAA